MGSQGSPCRWGRGQGVAPHIFLEGAVIPKCIVSLSGEFVVCAVKARWVTVTLDHRVKKVAVNHTVFLLGVARNPTNATLFVVSRALTLWGVVG